MKTLIVYDTAGYIIYTQTGNTSTLRTPEGIPTMWVEIPDGKQLKITNGIGVDTSVTPNVPILEDIPLPPKTPLEKRIKAIEVSLMSLL